MHIFVDSRSIIIIIVLIYAINMLHEDFTRKPGSRLEPEASRPRGTLREYLRFYEIL
jgi:hypothetical protein